MDLSDDDERKEISLALCSIFRLQALVGVCRLYLVASLSTFMKSLQKFSKVEGFTVNGINRFAIDDKQESTLALNQHFREGAEC